jgi:hypothetical protein
MWFLLYFGGLLYIFFGHGWYNSIKYKKIDYKSGVILLIAAFLLFLFDLIVSSLYFLDVPFLLFLVVPGTHSYHLLITPEWTECDYFLVYESEQFMFYLYDDIWVTFGAHVPIWMCFVPFSVLTRHYTPTIRDL